MLIETRQWRLRPKQQQQHPNECKVKPNRWIKKIIIHAITPKAFNGDLLSCARVAATLKSLMISESRFLRVDFVLGRFLVVCEIDGWIVDEAQSQRWWDAMQFEEVCLLWCSQRLIEFQLYDRRLVSFVQSHRLEPNGLRCLKCNVYLDDSCLAAIHYWRFTQWAAATCDFMTMHCHCLCSDFLSVNQNFMNWEWGFGDASLISKRQLARFEKTSI